MLEFQNVTKQFGDETYALQDVSFSVEPGELVFITGPSGSGKTTLMRLLTKEYKPTEGEIIFDGVPLSEVKNKHTHLHRRDIGVIFQDYKLVFDLNVWENIALALEILGKSDEEIEERVSDLLELVNLTDKAFLFPSQLSGGEAQRVSIARALATAPKLIFADEPTGNLDPVTSLHIAKLLKKINDLGTTILFSTHDVGILSHFSKTRRIELQHGKLVEDTEAKHKPKAKHSDKDETEPEVKVETEDIDDKEPQSQDKPSSKKKWGLPNPLAALKKKEKQVEKESKVEVEVESVDSVEPVKSGDSSDTKPTSEDEEEKENKKDKVKK